MKFSRDFWNFLKTLFLIRKTFILMKCILDICPSTNSYQVISTSQPTQLLFLSKQTNKNIQNMPTKRKIKIIS